MNLKKAYKIFDYLKSIDDNFHIAGSARRGKKEDLHDLDVIYVGDEVPKIPNHAAFIKGKDITRVKILGEQVDIYRTDPENFGAMLLFLTGPQEYNIIMRAKAKRKGMLLNQKGLYTRDTRELIASKTEEDIYNAMDLNYKPPELRRVKKGDLDTAAETIKQTKVSDKFPGLMKRRYDEYKLFLGQKITN